MKDKHNDDDDDDNEPSFYCSECGVLKATKKQLQNHEIYNLQYLYVLRKKIRLDQYLFLLISCLVVHIGPSFS